jgi:hypothetical protein
MDSEKDLHEAVMYAQAGLGFNPDIRTSIFAHFVLADIYNRLGRHEEAGQHVSKARECRKKSPNDSYQVNKSERFPLIAKSKNRSPFLFLDDIQDKMCNRSFYAG